MDLLPQMMQMMQMLAMKHPLLKKNKTNTKQKMQATKTYQLASLLIMVGTSVH